MVVPASTRRVFVRCLCVLASERDFGDVLPPDSWRLAIVAASGIVVFFGILDIVHYLA